MFINGIRAKYLSKKRGQEDLIMILLPLKFVCCVRRKALHKNGRKFGYESPAELQTFEASKSLIHAAEIRNDAWVILAIKDQHLIALEVKSHKSCFRDYINAKTLDRIKIKNEQENEKMSIYDKAFDRVVKIVRDTVVDCS